MVGRLRGLETRLWLIRILLLILRLLRLRRVLLIQEVTSVGRRIGRHSTPAIFMLLGAIDWLRKSGRCRRIHSRVRSVEVVLVVKLKVQSQTIVVVVHDGRLTDQRKGESLPRSTAMSTSTSTIVAGCRFRSDGIRKERSRVDSEAFTPRMEQSSPQFNRSR